MDILITTGIFEPESGGPATYAPKLAKRLVERGHEVKVITYSDKEEYDFDEDYPFPVERIVRSNKLSNYWRFFRSVYSQIDEYDIVYTLDWTAAGFPVSLASRLSGVPYAIRVGGGYIWERYLDTGREPMSLREFYRRGLQTDFPALFRMIKFVFSGAEKIIFNTKVQPQFFQQPYNLSDEQITTIFNPVPDPDVGISREEPNDEIIFAGRLIEMKNTKSLVRAFARADTSKRLVIVGDGPQKDEIRKLVNDLGIENRVEMQDALKQDKFFKRIIDAHLMVQPSWTDISPNLIYECLALNVPFLVTKENYMAIRDDLPLTVDPHSVADISRKLEYLEDPGNYDEYTRSLQNISYDNTWEDVTDQHEQVFSEIIG